LNPTISTSLQTYSFSFLVPSTAKTLRIGVGTGSVVNTNYIIFGNVQLEAGAVATPFEFEDIGTTLAKCQRYFETQDWTINTWRNAVVYATGVTANGYFMYQPKRTTPSFSWSSNGSARYIYHNGNIGGSQTLSASYSSYNGSSFNTSGTFAFSSGWVDNAGTLSISSEL
jgi:hypothetical protein